MSLLPVAEARARLLALAPDIPVEQTALADAVGRWAVSDVTARRTQPDTDVSAMDGYALRFADLPGPLSVIGESAAGRPFPGSVAAGQAVRIFTGAAVPDGADTVLLQEDARREADSVRASDDSRSRPAAHIRARGIDFHAGDRLIARGQALTPARIALAAVAGHGTLPVRRRLRVAIAATGDELATPGQPLAPGRLPESNAAMLTAMLVGLPVEPVPLGILPDDRARLAAAFGSVDADILVTTGGASVGDHDLVRPALEDIGADFEFWRIAMRPGKPMMACRLGDSVVLGLPGNPVSAFVTATLFLLPLVRHMAGSPAPWSSLSSATLTQDLPPNDHREDYPRARLAAGRVTPLGRQDSSLLRDLSDADCLIRRPPFAPAARAGDEVEILPIA